MATPTPPKSMSSRLLTMKFMQRAAASAPTPTSPSNEDQSSKRRKISHGASADSGVDSLVDQQAIQAAIDEGEKKRQEALVKNAADSGDAHWVLDVPQNVPGLGGHVQTPLNVVQVGYAQIDSVDMSGQGADSSDTAPTFRRYNMKEKKKDKAAKPSSDSESSDEDSDGSAESDSDSSPNTASGRKSYTGSHRGTPSTPRPGLNGKQKAESAKAREFAEKRRKKEIKLNKSGLGSISSGGSPSLSGARQQPTSSSPAFKHQGNNRRGR